MRKARQRNKKRKNASLPTKKNTFLKKGNYLCSLQRMALRRSAAALRGAAEWVLNDASRPLASKAAAHASNAGAAIEYDIPTAYAGHRVEPPSSRVTTSPEELIDLFRTMYLMRRIEIGSDTLYKSKFIRGFCHLYDGQEAVAAGMERALTYDDAIITAYRDHCIHLGRGGTPLEIMAELMGRTSGASNGKGGSMHLYHKRNNYYGGCGIVGAQTPLGAGLAFALKYEGKADNVCFCLYGDGAANQGQLFESYNLAALWDLPIVYVCENNHYGMGTAKHRASKSPEYYTRGDFVPGLKVDGMDALCVKQACAFAKSYASRNVRKRSNT